MSEDGRSHLIGNGRVFPAKHVKIIADRYGQHDGGNAEHATSLAPHA
jgi:hypothetical protein